MKYTYKYLTANDIKSNSFEPKEGVAISYNKYALKTYAMQYLGRIVIEIVKVEP